MTVKHTNDRLQYEFSEPLGDDYFDLTFLQGNEPVRSLSCVRRAGACNDT